MYDADTALQDHTHKLIARPNNDTLYITCLLDLRNDPVILDMPAFDSKYVSLMVTGYDHYVNIPMSTRRGDFKKPERMLFFTERTEGYKKGTKIKGVDRYDPARAVVVPPTGLIHDHLQARDNCTWTKTTSKERTIVSRNITPQQVLLNQ